MPRETDSPLRCGGLACALRSRALRGQFAASPLRELAAAILFCLVATSPLWAADWLDQRREAVEKMTPAEKEDLGDKYDKFLKLSADEQKQLRTLHDQLDIDPNGDRLRHIMQRYHDWLKDLPTTQKDNLLQLPTEAERLAQIKTLKQEQEAQATGSHMTRPDLKVIADWVKKYAVDHADQFHREMSSRFHGQSFTSSDPAAHEQHERMVQNRIFWHLAGEKSLKVSAQEIDDLASHLSAKPRVAIDNQPTNHDKAELIHGWLKAIAATKFTGFGRQGMNVNPKVLAQYFETLPKEQQKEVLKLTDQNEQRRELHKLYFQHLRSMGSAPSAGGEMHPRFNRPGSASPPANEKSEKTPDNAPADKPLPDKQPTDSEPAATVQPSTSPNAAKK